MRNYIAVALICLLSTLCPTSQVQGQRVLLCPQETLAETLRGEYAPVRQARYRWDPVGGARFQMPSLARRLRLLSQGRIDEIPYLPDGDAIDFQACLYRTRQVWEDTLALLNRGLHSVVLELVEAWDADSIRTRFGLSEKKFRKAEIGPVLNALAGGRLREGKSVRRGTPGFAFFDGLRPYTYEGKHCMVVWDDVSKNQVSKNPQGFADAPSGEYFWDFTYTFQDARQVALCRYSENCYVLLLLTRPMVEMD